MSQKTVLRDTSSIRVVGIGRQFIRLDGLSVPESKNVFLSLRWVWSHGTKKEEDGSKG